ncbi:Alpha-N-acetylglucosaminidase, tim-barrel domain [Dillenia turbinata]|uniref:Alpha-N-acetylglucosaminidase, tim-barrel domain n=1 Tax=Dillenia turbinata TaxID=194707 RepID=A0AAN8ZH69_9MAGN
MKQFRVILLDISDLTLKADRTRIQQLKLLQIPMSGGIGKDGKEMDWMALQGVNLPLAFTGREAIWQKLQLFTMFWSAALETILVNVIDQIQQNPLWFLSQYLEHIGFAGTQYYIDELISELRP